MTEEHVCEWWGVDSRNVYLFCPHCFAYKYGDDSGHARTLSFSWSNFMYLARAYERDQRGISREMKLRSINQWKSL